MAWIFSNVSRHKDPHPPLEVIAEILPHVVMLLHHNDKVSWKLLITVYGQILRESFGKGGQKLSIFHGFLTNIAILTLKMVNIADFRYIVGALRSPPIVILIEAVQSAVGTVVCFRV